MEIPSVLEGQVREGKAVLFLGAGASLDARDPKGNRPPSGKELGSLLSDRFLGGKHKALPLNQIGEYAISEADLPTVQEYIREIFEVFEPSEAHRRMTSFLWWGLATSNYECLIERAYDTTPDALQVPRPFIENGDRVEDHVRDPRHVMLLKLHGCITRTSNPSCPLILTTDQYIVHRHGRSRIFDHLRGWAFERPIVFIGHGLQDPDLRAILLELTSSVETRPRYYAVLPEVDDIHRRFWEGKKVTLIQGTFLDFLRALDAKIPHEFRPLAVIADRKALPISENFKVHDSVISHACAEFLRVDVDYVKGVTATETVSPRNFYRGMSPGWSAIEQNLDVRRHLSDTIISDNFLIEESTHETGPEFILIRAHAGAGKSVLLRRIAWDASRDYGLLCLFLRPHGIINSAAIQELINLCQERIYLFVDDAADRVRELLALASGIGPEGKKLTVILAERINEWNVSGAELSPFVSSIYELKYLSLKEIDGLLTLLEKHRALGTLEHMGPDARRSAFAERAGRQLLVALHEATLGKRFEDIIEDEFANISPLEAQRIYLSICVLNRLEVPVRAGVIARIHGVPFEDFKQRLFKPLEHVVETKFDPIVRDYMYCARHPHIADIVFERVLRVQEERFDAYIRCLSELNIDYSSDRRAFRQMIRGRTVIELFPNHELACRVYELAMSRVGEDAYLLHQMGLYEMHRPNGNLQESANLLSRASTLAPWDSSIKHSIAEHRLRSAEDARTTLEADKLLKEAAEISMSLKSSRSNNEFAHHTLVKIGLRKLKDLLERTEEMQSEAEVEQLVKEIERNLSDGLQRFPCNAYLLGAESQLAQILNDSKRVLESLHRTFAVNPRNSFAAIRLSQIYLSQDDLDKSRDILEKALDANRGERRLHFAYARLLMVTENAPGDQLAYHLQRSFTPGDTNYTAQLLYGRQLFINGDWGGSKMVFRTLGSARVGAELRDALVYPLDQIHRGSIARMEASYCFIARDGVGDWIYAHRNNISDAVWNILLMGTRVTFRIAFTFRGPNAFDVEIAK